MEYITGQLKEFVNEHKIIKSWYSRELAENYELDTPENLESFTIKHRKELIYIMELIEKINRIQTKEPF